MRKKLKSSLKLEQKIVQSLPIVQPSQDDTNDRYILPKLQELPELLQEEKFISEKQTSKGAQAIPTVKPLLLVGPSLVVEKACNFIQTIPLVSTAPKFKQIIEVQKSGNHNILKLFL